MTDASLVNIIEGCRRGREAAMQAFYERFYSYALSVCLAYANDYEDARELVNDGFLKAFRHLENLNNDAAVHTWLRRILVNTAIDHYRKTKKRAVEIPAERVADSLAEPTWNPDTLFAQLSAEAILAALHQLPTPYRLVFSLYVLEGYAHREIAQRLSITESTSRSHLTEANRRLRRILTAQTTPNHERTGR